MARGDRPCQRAAAHRRLWKPAAATCASTSARSPAPREDQNAAEQSQQRQTLTGQPAKNTGPYRFTGINKGGPRRRDAALRPVHGHLNDRAENPQPQRDAEQGRRQRRHRFTCRLHGGESHQRRGRQLHHRHPADIDFPGRALIRIISAAIATALARVIISPRQAPADYFPARPAELNQ